LHGLFLFDILVQEMVMVKIEGIQHLHHYSPLIEDITGFNPMEELCAETVKYMAKRLTDTKYSRTFRFKYTIFENEYKTLVEIFNKQAEKNEGLR
jgi:hypothetical protein